MKKRIIASILALSAVLSLAGCGNNNTTAASDDNDASANDSQQVRTVRVATRGTFRPFTYLDENNNLTGYDIEVLKLIDEKLPDVQFEFQTMDLSAAFVALDGGQLDMVANQLVHNDERDAKYIFPEIPYNYAYSRLVVRGDEDNITTLDDLQGKTMALIPTDEVTTLVNQYNETAKNPIKTKFFDGGSAETFAQLATGQVDATHGYKANVDNAVQDNGYDIKTVGDPISAQPVFFILAKTDENQKLADEIDQVLQELKDDGTLSKLCIEFVGEDVTNPLED